MRLACSVRPRPSTARAGRVGELSPSMRGSYALAAGTAAMLVACANEAAPSLGIAATRTIAVAPDRTQNPQRYQRVDSAGRCGRFSLDFAELAACRRADGTLRTFVQPRIAWRVRYFVRYWKMPCGEAPTRDESYVFAMTTRDLYGDADVNDAERRAIRDAMFEGSVRCR